MSDHVSQSRALYMSMLRITDELEGIECLAQALTMEHARIAIENCRYQLETAIRTCGRAGKWDAVPWTAEHERAARAWFEDPDKPKPGRRG